jgi:uncharacterized protein (TIGR02246 family)
VVTWFPSSVVQLTASEARTSLPGVNDMATLEARLQRLEDLQEITQLLVDYGELLDLRDLDGFAALWADDAEFVMSTGRTAQGRDAIRAMLADTMARSTQIVRHLEANARVTLDGDRATATTMFAVASTQDDGLARVTMFGHHHDELVRTDEGWRLWRRHNVVDLPETGHP